MKKVFAIIATACLAVASSAAFANEAQEWDVMEIAQAQAGQETVVRPGDHQGGPVVMRDVGAIKNLLVVAKDSTRERGVEVIAKAAHKACKKYGELRNIVYLPGGHPNPKGGHLSSLDDSFDMGLASSDLATSADALDGFQGDDSKRAKKVGALVSCSVRAR